jgi:PDZ domain-containing protein
MSRRAITLTVAACIVVVLAVVAAVLPVPYVALSPGPTGNVLGDFNGNAPLIQVSGRQTYKTTGHLNFVTVAYQGGPGDELDLFSALHGWLDSSDAVVPQQVLFPANTSVSQVQQQDTEEMTDSQTSATAAALSELKIPYQTWPGVVQVQKGKPAYGKLKGGDIIVAVNGKPITTVAGASNAIDANKPGSTVHITVRRAGTEVTEAMTTVADPQQSNKPVIGIVLQEQYKFPFTVRIDIGNVGGPSAGLMFALGIYDKVSGQNITGGQFIAGTGTIDPNGNVGEIGGIQQKMVAARDAGARYFFTPSGNCSDAVPADPKGLRLIKVNTMQNALDALKTIRTGQGTLSSCPG